ncbi:MAG: Gfo/Idh/MocA family oxidoreductase [Gemmatimonadaceae bacterium]
MSQDNDLSRRDLLKTAAIAGIGLTLGGAQDAQAEPVRLHEPDVVPPAAGESMMDVKFEARAVPRIAIVGTGLRGRSVLNELLGVGGVKITALCDLVPDKVEKAKAMMKKAGHDYEPAVYTGGERDFEKLCARDDIDFVYTATPWRWHVPVVLAAMKHGKHAGTEVPAALTIEDCWALVDTSEKTRRHCLIMENCCYGYNELLVLQMVRAGAFGDLKHGGAAYNHDLRSILFETRDEGLWRRAAHTERNGNLYPTHGLGPVAWYMGVHRGDRLDYMVSMSTPEFGLTKWREDHIPKDDPRWKEKYVNGDLNSSLVKTAKGRTIRLEHNVSSPRPYSRINSIEGTKGLFEDYPARIYVEGRGKDDVWTGIDDYKNEFEHPWWKEQGDRARNGGHGGMDFIMAWRLVTCLREGLAPDLNVYDAAAWSAPGPLSEKSVKMGSAPVKFPDFTRGRWRA